MATKLKNSVVREVAGWCRKGVFGMGGRTTDRDLVVSMLPGGVFTFREKGRRKTYDIDIETVYYLAVKASLRADKKEKSKQRKLKKLIR